MNKNPKHNARANKAKSVGAAKALKSTGGYYTSAVYKMPRGAELQRRIEMVVKLAKAKEKLGLAPRGEDVVRHLRAGHSWSQMRAVKVS